MMDAICSGKDKVDYVLVFKLSRFGRNTADIMNSLQIMEDYGAHLLCVEDKLDSAGPAGKLMISVLSAVTEIERENIREQTMEGRNQKASNGLWNGGQAPYGYLIERNEKGKGTGILLVNEDEAPLVRMIFDKYLNTTMGTNNIAKWLNENGYKKSLRNNTSISGISSSFVKGILDNPVYMGKIAYGRRRNEKIDGTRNEYHTIKQSDDSYVLHDGKHDAIISEEDWYKVKAKRSINAFKREKTHSLGHAHVLSGLLKCPICGSPMYGQPARKKKKDGSGEYYTDMWYYLCKSAKQQTGNHCSFKRHIRQDVVDREIDALIKNILTESDFKERVLERVGSNDNLSELLEQETRLKEQRKKIETQKKRQLTKIIELDADSDVYDDLYENLQNVLEEQIRKINTLDEQIEENLMAISNARAGELTAEAYRDLLNTILENIEVFDDNDKKALMNQIIEKIEIFPEKTKDGRWVRSVQLKMPLNNNGEIADIVDFDWNDDEGDDEKNSLPYQTTDESVVLMSRKQLLI